MKKTIKRALVALTASAALLVSPLAAYAAPPAVDPSPDAPWSETGKAYTGSIEVHKYMAASGSLENVTNDGTKQNAEALAGLTPVQNVEYTVEKLDSITYTVVKEGTPAEEKQETFNVDVTNFDTWTKISGLVKKFNANPSAETIQLDASNVDVPEGYTLKDEPATLKFVDATPVSVTTNESGSAKFDNLALGLYRVTEGDPVNAQTASGKLDGLTAAAPFYMTVPIALANDTDPVNNTQFLYATHVYPKNQVDTVTKNISSAAKSYLPGDKISYDVTATINAYTANNLHGYAIYDKPAPQGFAEVEEALGMGSLDTQDESLKATVGTVVLLKGDGNVSETLSPGTDYTVELKEEIVFDPMVKPGSSSGKAMPRIQVNFTEAGLEKIAAAKRADQGAQVRVTYTFTISEYVGSGDAIVNNGGFVLGRPAGVDPSTPPTEKPTDPSKDPVLHLKDFTLTKVDAGDATKKLEGAEFYVFSTKEAADLCAKDTAQCANSESLHKTIAAPAGASDGMEKPGAGGGAGPIMVTGADGTAKSSKPISDGTYYFVEIKAPTGYVKTPNTIAITLTHVDGEPGYAATITNVPQQDGASWFGLPATGSTGVVILAIIGAVLILGGAALFSYTAKRRKEQQHSA